MGESFLSEKVIGFLAEGVEYAMPFEFVIPSQDLMPCFPDFQQLDKSAQPMMVKGGLQ
ncbi:hypothetical protein ACQKFG_06025 [Peribacillus sp. NPDC076916]|uniref:hypothetical protein n=1 Tax=Peribacillus sp. NPDC076916 TaxID=3390608 RepID=UPI003D073D41